MSTFRAEMSGLSILDTRKRPQHYSPNGGSSGSGGFWNGSATGVAPPQPPGNWIGQQQQQPLVGRYPAGMSYGRVDAGNPLVGVPPRQIYQQQQHQHEVRVVYQPKLGPRMQHDSGQFQ